MKWFRRWLILMAILLALGLGVLSGYKVLTVEINTTVEEIIEVEPSTVTVDIDPNETISQSFTVRNTGRADISVILENRVVPDELTLSIQDAIVVPANSEVQVIAEITAPPNIAPGTYLIEVAVER